MANDQSDGDTIKSAKQIVADCNQLAKRYYSMHGYCVPDGYRFDKAHHPQEQLMWDMAVEAYDHIEGTPVEDCLTESESHNE